MNNFDLMNPDFQETGRLQIKSGDGNKLHVLDFRQYHRLTRYDVENLDQLLKDYCQALVTTSHILYRIGRWATSSPDEGGSFDELIGMLPDIKRALDIAGVAIGEAES
jgi:hypothetical protein